MKTKSNWLEKTILENQKSHKHNVANSWKRACDKHGEVSANEIFPTGKQIWETLNPVICETCGGLGMKNGYFCNCMR